MKRLIKDNRGQVLYAVVVTVMLMSVLAMIAMGLTLQNYHAAAQKQQHVTDYYAADAVAELIRTNKFDESADEAYWEADVTNTGTKYTIVRGTVTIITVIEGGEFKSWEVSYHAATEQTE